MTAGILSVAPLPAPRWALTAAGSAVPAVALAVVADGAGQRAAFVFEVTGPGGVELALVPGPGSWVLLPHGEAPDPAGRHAAIVAALAAEPLPVVPDDGIPAAGRPHRRKTHA